MALSIANLRRWFALAAVLVCLIVAGVYFRARHNVQNALKQVPQKLNIQVQQSAEGFTISKSEQGRTLFKLQASKAVQYKGGARAELHDVMITIYGRDSSRFDQIYGKAFEYDQQSGNVTSQGEVSIDLQSNPQGISNPDQATPRELKNPIHLKTTNLVFNQKTGDAWTSSLVEFYVPQLTGSAVGAKYNSKDNVLTLESQVRMVVNGTNPLTIQAEHATLAKNPREIVLQQPRTDSTHRHGQADKAMLFLRDDNTLDRAIATGSVAIDATDHKVPGTSASTSHVTAQKLDLAMGAKNRIESAVLSGDVRLQTTGRQPGEASAGKAVLSFAPHNVLKKIHATEDVKVLQHQHSAGSKSQDFQVNAPTIDLLLADGNRLTQAETSGPPQLLLSPAEGSPGPQTRITADKFIAEFDSLGQLSHVHGNAHARVVTTAPPQNHGPATDRVSSSDSIDAYFRPGNGIEALVQQGHFSYTAGTQQAFGQKARYTPADQILVLTGEPRILDSGMETSARTVRLNRATGEGLASGDVKTTYSDLRPQPDGALLASSDPIHITAESMTAQNNPGIATYRGNVRLWQDANIIEAPTIRFEKDQRIVVADSNSRQQVATELISTDKDGKTTAVDVTSDHLIYRDSERKAHYFGSVVARGEDMKVTCDQMDVFFAPASGEQSQGPSVARRGGGPASTSQTRASGSTPATRQSEIKAKLDRIVASGSVVFTQPSRHATGNVLTYTASDDKFVLTGGPPAVFDAEHGKVTGISLTMFRSDDRIIVDGSTTSPAVTETNVTRH